MSLSHAILGFLSYRSFTGYELKRVFDGTVRHFWSADQSQIYRTLSRLHETGRIGVEIVPQDDRPSRKVYSITPSGRTALREWLRGEAIRLEPRDGFLMQLFFAGRLSDEETVRLLEERAEGLRSLLDGYAQHVDEDRVANLAVLPPREQFFWYLTLDSGFDVMQARLQWTEATIEKIRSKAYKHGRDGALTHRRMS